jgi:cyanobactin maturation PatA/PatG family protease
LLLPYLESHPEELDQVNWTLTREDCPCYAIEPTGRYRSDIYQLLLQLRQGFLSTEDRLERISLPGILTPKSQELHSGQSIPVVGVSLTRGLYGWSTASLLQAVDPSGSNFRLRQAMRDFLERIYADLDNPGLKAPQRALNFAATNIFQAAFSLSEAINQGFELFDIEVDRSPFCRIFSDCWEVKLKFQDPDNCQRAYRVHRFTVDVSDILPVTLGSIRSWASHTH